MVKVYGNDLHVRRSQLHTQLSLLSLLLSQMDSSALSVTSIVQALQKLSVAEQEAFSEVWTMMKLLLVMPATNATSERSFSVLRRVKTYLHSSMSQRHLNHLMVLHVHKERTESLDLRCIG